ncbi:hypothetical protein Droror1_Dr00024476 [Drosera rotundifolia]
MPLTFQRQLLISLLTFLLHHRTPVFSQSPTTATNSSPATPHKSPSSHSPLSPLRLLRTIVHRNPPHHPATAHLCAASFPATPYLYPASTQLRSSRLLHANLERAGAAWIRLLGRWWLRVQRCPGVVTTEMVVAAETEEGEEGGVCGGVGSIG